MDRKHIVYLSLFPEWKFIGERNCILLRKITYLLNLPIMPYELIKKINIQYIVHEISKTDPKNIITCSKIECISKWNGYFKIGTDLTKFNNLSHCEKYKCHTIFIPTKSSVCLTCKKYFCKSCKKWGNNAVTHQNCEDCIVTQLGETMGVECKQQ